MAVVRQDVVKMGFDVDMAELDKLRSSLDEIKKTLTGGLGDDAFDDVIKDSKAASKGIDDIKDSLDDIKPDGIEETVKVLKNTDTKAGDAHESLKKIARTGFDKTISGLKKMAGALGTVAKKAAKLVAKGLVAGAAGVGALVTKSVMNYAEYEQLVGGVETLFKDSAGTVQLYADNAYKTAGLSANDYMSTVTSFSASLIQSLGGNTGKAAEYANMAIIDMSDNANKMGTDMSSIQDAYQGFAKQNYTMLDNLKLGYGGTKTEMERLLKDATALSGVKYDINSYADIVAAIHVVQQELGITGTTSKEASETISGSFNALKSAWGNTMTSLILGGDDFDRCVDNLIDSAKTFGKNIMPAITKGLNGVGSLISELAPHIERELPGIIDALLPPLLKAATSLLKGIIKALPSIISTLIDEIPSVLSQVWSAFKDAFGEIPGMAKAEAFFNNLIGFIQNNADTIKKLVPAMIALVVAFKLFKKVQGIAGIFGGGKGGSSGGIFSSFANMKPIQALKGMANLAIILGGLAALAAVIMWAAPYMAQLSDIGSLAEVLLAITAVGLIGTAMATLAGKVGLIPVVVVAKGLANIAIVMLGFGALAAVLMWLAPYITQLSDIRTTFKLLLVIGAVGLVGSALAGLAGLVGAIPTAVVLTGLANIALVLGGFTAIVTAFGALSTIDGFNEFLTSGGETLATICGIIGKMAGSIIGGIGEGITDSLPAIGDNLSAFASSIQPMFAVFSGVDTDSLSSFASSFAAFIAVIAGEKLVSVITGGIDYEGLGAKLSSMATSLSSFFSTVLTFPDAAFDKATALFDCLAGIKDLPEEGGVVGWFKGEVDYAAMATGLMQLAGATGFFTAIQAIPDEAFAKATALFDCLNGIGQLPNSGGVVQWFTGEVDYAGIASGVQTLASEGMIAALTAITSIPAESYASLTALFDALAGVKQMPKEGGIVGWFSGENSTGLSNVASQLPGVATNIATFFTNLGGRTDFSPIKTLFDTLSSVKIDSDAADKGFLGLGSSELEKMGQGLSDFATKAKTFLDEINNLNVTNLQTFFDNLSTAGDLPDKLSGINGDIGTELSGLVDTAKTKLGEVKTAVVSGLDAVLAVFTDKAAAFKTSGAAMMDGLNIGMSSKLPVLIATAQSMAAAITRAFDVEMDINSPSGVMIDRGEYTGEGGIIGLRNMIPDARKASQDFAIASTPFNDYTPEGSAETVYNSRSSSDVTNVAPVFNLSISGTQDDRAMARKVKRFVDEAIQDTFESLERKSAVLREV